MEIILGLFALYGGIMLVGYLLTCGAFVVICGVVAGGIVFAIAAKILIFIMRLIAEARGLEALKRFETRREKIFNFFGCDSEFAIIFAISIVCIVVVLVGISLHWGYKTLGSVGTVIVGIIIFAILKAVISELFR